MKRSLLPIALAVLSVTFASGQGCCPPEEGAAKAKPAAQSAAKMVNGVQKASVKVENAAYSPAVVKVKVGKPVELAFRLGEKPGCGGTLVVKDLKVREKLSADKDTVVKFTPKKKGTIAFTCGMGMYDGKIVVE